MSNIIDEKRTMITVWPCQVYPFSQPFKSGLFGHSWNRPGSGTPGQFQALREFKIGGDIHAGHLFATGDPV